MKKIFSLITAAVIALSLAACGETKDAANAENVAVFYYTYSDPYISTVRQSLGSELSSRGIAHHDYDSNSSQTTQREQVQTAITKGAKLLVVNIVETGSDDAANGIVSLARAANIPLVFFNREVSDGVINSYENSVFVGTDAAEAGHMQGELIAEYLLADYDKYDLNGDGKISYVLFKGQEGNAEAEYRTKFSVEDADALIKKAGRGGLVFYDAKNKSGYLADKNGTWSASAANEYMTTVLTEYNEKNKNMVEAVICNNDNMAEGAITALNTAGYNSGGDKKIPVFGVDAQSSARELIKAGKMAGTIKQDAEGMARAIAELCENVTENKGIRASADKFTVDEKAFKIRIPYAKYTGE